MNQQRKVVFSSASTSSRPSTGRHRRRHAPERDDTLVAKHIPENAYPEQWDAAGLKEGVRVNLDLDVPVDDWAKEGIADEEVRDRLTKAAEAASKNHANRFGPEVMTYVERSVLLQTLDGLARIWSISTICAPWWASAAMLSATR